MYRLLKNAVPLKWKIAAHKGYDVARQELANLPARLRCLWLGEPRIPPGGYMRLVVGTANASAFLTGGESAAAAIRETLTRNGVPLEALHSILDFGCGAGRIIRHWQNLKGPELHGVDYNPTLVKWCERGLRFAKFQVNTLKGRLPYPDERFDLVYAFSVFTHMSDALQRNWIAELWRVLRSGGYLYLTVHGEYYLHRLEPEQREKFLRGELVIVGSDQEGSNQLGAYHPERYVRETLARGFVVLDHVPEGARGYSLHDIYLLRKPPVGT